MENGGSITKFRIGVYNGSRGGVAVFTSATVVQIAVRRQCLGSNPNRGKTAVLLFFGGVAWPGRPEGASERCHLGLGAWSWKGKAR